MAICIDAPDEVDEFWLNIRNEPDDNYDSSSGASPATIKVQIANSFHSYDIAVGVTNGDAIRRAVSIVIVDNRSVLPSGVETTIRLVLNTIYLLDSRNHHRLAMEHIAEFMDEPMQAL